MGYREHAVSGPLAKWVECSWTRDGPDRHDRIVPDGSMDLIWSERAGLSVVGPNTTAFLAPLRRDQAVVGIRLHPGAAPPLLGVHAPELRDARLPAERVWGDPAQRLEEEVRRLEGPVERARRLVAFLAECAATEPDPLVRQAVRRLRRSRVGEVADELAVSERHLRRLVSAHVGYGPKLLARVLRLQAALRRVRAGAELAEVAFEAGYADQAHFTHDCRELAGVPPGRFLQDVAA